MMTATRRVTLVWIALLVLTFGSFLIGIEQSADLGHAATILIIGIALLKVRLIGVHFMDLRIAPTPLRMIFEGYLLALFAALVLLDLLVKP